MPIPQTIAWTPAHGVRILDQTLLPLEERYLKLNTVEQVAEAIERLRVRGAPLIGIAAAMGVVQALRREAGDSDGAAIPRARALELVQAACDRLKATRPTAVNLEWALNRMRRRAEGTLGNLATVRDALIAEATNIWDSDRVMCDRIGAAGLALIPDGATIMTHCNAGSLATGGIGTALAPVYAAHAEGRRVQVLADETRPLLQGSRLTAWELTRAGIVCTVITDGMAASRLRLGDVTCVIVGADRIAANGDVANKIGTYGLALAARAHEVPFYVAAPRSTIDLGTPDGSRIPIEERRAEEVTGLGGRRTAPVGIAVWNPAFDVTPAALITAIITDDGVVVPSDIASRFG